MRDDRTSGIYGMGNYISFKKNDNTGLVNAIPDKKRQKDKNSNQNEENENNKQESLETSPYVDNSDKLNASLNSLAILNAAGVSVINKKKFTKRKIEKKRQAHY